MVNIASQILDEDIKALRTQAVLHTDHVACIISHVKRAFGPEASVELQKHFDLKDDFEDLETTFPPLVGLLPEEGLPVEEQPAAASVTGQTTSRTSTAQSSATSAAQSGVTHHEQVAGAAGDCDMDDATSVRSAHADSVFHAEMPETRVSQEVVVGPEGEEGLFAVREVEA